MKSTGDWGELCRYGVGRGRGFFDFWRFVKRVVGLGIVGCIMESVSKEYCFCDFVRVSIRVRRGY